MSRVPSPAAINRIRAAVRWVEGQGANVVGAPGAARGQREGFWARITGDPGASGQAWERVLWDAATSAWVVMDPAVTGSQAYEADGQPAAPGAVVWLRVVGQNETGAIYVYASRLDGFWAVTTGLETFAEVRRGDGGGIWEYVVGGRGGQFVDAQRFSTGDQPPKGTIVWMLESRDESGTPIYWCADLNRGTFWKDLNVDGNDLSLALPDPTRHTLDLESAKWYYYEQGDYRRINWTAITNIFVGDATHSPKFMTRKFQLDSAGQFREVPKELDGSNFGDLVSVPVGPGAFDAGTYALTFSTRQIYVLKDIGAGAGLSIDLSGIKGAIDDVANDLAALVGDNLWIQRDGSVFKHIGPYAADPAPVTDTITDVTFSSGTYSFQRKDVKRDSKGHIISVTNNGAAVTLVDHLVAADSSDSAPGVLLDKLVAGNEWLTFTVKADHSAIEGKHAVPAVTGTTHPNNVVTGLDAYDSGGGAYKLRIKFKPITLDAQNHVVAEGAETSVTCDLQAFTAITDLQIGATHVEGKTQTAYVPVVGTKSAWTNLLALDDCET